MGDAIDLSGRRNISDEVATTLRDMIYDGELAAGQRINEVLLSGRLGVSRTPLREALTMLVAEGALTSIPRRGCFVKPLTREEFEDIYPMRSILEPEALMRSGIPSAATFAKLERINEKMRATKDMKARMSMDEIWHLELLSGCHNRVLLDLIRHFMHRFRRYGLAFARDRRVMESAKREHVEIIRALKSGDLGGACDWLRRNVTSSKEPILEWLEENADREARCAV